MDPEKKLAMQLMARNKGMTPEAALKLSRQLLADPSIPLGKTGQSFSTPQPSASAGLTDPEAIYGPNKADIQSDPNREAMEYIGGSVKDALIGSARPAVEPGMMQRALEQMKLKQARVQHYEQTKAAMQAGQPVAPHDAAYVRQIDSRPPVKVPSLPSRDDEYGMFGGSVPGVRKLVYNSPETGRLFVPDHPPNSMPAPKPDGKTLKMDATDFANVIDERGRPMAVVEGGPPQPGPDAKDFHSGVYSHDQAIKDALSGTQQGNSAFINRALETEYGKHLDEFENNGGDWPDGYFVGHEDDEDTVRKGVRYLKVLRDFNNATSGGTY